MKLPTVLTIAGSDCSGGAGIQADIKTMTVNGVYAMSAITALTAQNTTGVCGIMEVTPDFLGQQLDAVFEDIYPDAVKIGMIPSVCLLEMTAEKLKQYKAQNIVVDPVMVASSGARLMEEAAVSLLKQKLLPITSLITPNIPEAEFLTSTSVHSKEDMSAAAKQLGEQYDCAVLVKGGHSAQDASDVLYVDGKLHWFAGSRIKNNNTHGTGCTLSSAIAASLARGFSMEESVQRAKEYLSGALSAMLDLGEGSGPLHHAYNIKNI